MPCNARDCLSPGGRVATVHGRLSHPLGRAQWLGHSADDFCRNQSGQRRPRASVGLPREWPEFKPSGAGRVLAKPGVPGLAVSPSPSLHTLTKGFPPLRWDVGPRRDSQGHIRRPPARLPWPRGQTCPHKQSVAIPVPTGPAAHKAASRVCGCAAVGLTETGPTRVACGVGLLSLCRRHSTLCHTVACVSAAADVNVPEVRATRD